MNGHPVNRGGGDSQVEAPRGQLDVLSAADDEVSRWAGGVELSSHPWAWLDRDAPARPATHLTVVLPKVHRLLRPHGVFAVWRNVVGEPEAAVTPLRNRVAQIVRARTTPSRPGPDSEDVALTRARLTASALVTAEDGVVFRWSIEFNEGQVRRLFSRLSDWAAPEVEEAATAVSELGGRVVEHYQTWLIVLNPGPTYR